MSPIPNRQRLIVAEADTGGNAAHYTYRRAGEGDVLVSIHLAHAGPPLRASSADSGILTVMRPDGYWYVAKLPEGLSAPPGAALARGWLGPNETGGGMTHEQRTAIEAGRCPTYVLSPTDGQRECCGRPVHADDDQAPYCRPEHRAAGPLGYTPTGTAS